MTEAQPIIVTDDKPEPVPRKLSREARRGQLIEATIETLATRGYARTTLTEVAKVAGLSHGLVNFHFQTKEKLLAETLQHLADEYRQNWTAALEAAPKDPAAQLDALLRADFNPLIYTPGRLAAWVSFWGEAQNRPLYQECCGANDVRYNATLEQICADLMTTHGYAGKASYVARVLRVTLEGVWLDVITTDAEFDRAEAQTTVFTCAAAFFPRHFGENGLLATQGI